LRAILVLPNAIITLSIVLPGLSLFGSVELHDDERVQHVEQERPVDTNRQGV
jgi:hypothetical protein